MFDQQKTFDFDIRMQYRAIVEVARKRVLFGSSGFSWVLLLNAISLGNLPWFKIIWEGCPLTSCALDKLHSRFPANLLWFMEIPSYLKFSGRNSPLRFDFYSDCLWGIKFGLFFLESLCSMVHDIWWKVQVAITSSARRTRPSFLQNSTICCWFSSASTWRRQEKLLEKKVSCCSRSIFNFKNLY